MGDRVRLKTRFQPHESEKLTGRVLHPGFVAYLLFPKSPVVRVRVRVHISVTLNGNWSWIPKLEVGIKIEISPRDSWLLC